MRIAVLTNDYAPHAQGGAGVIAEMQVRGLESRGHIVNVFVSTSDLSRRHPFERLFFHLRDAGSRRKLVDDISAWKPDVLLTHNLMGCGFGTPRVVVRTLGIRWIHMLHDVQLIEPLGQIVAGESWSILRRARRRILAYLRRRMFGLPNLVVSPTRWLLDVHQGYGFFCGVKTEVIPNPLLDIGSAPLGGATSFGHRSTDMLYVGRTSFDKGVDVLVEAWKMLSEPRPRLRLVGEGSYKDILVKEQTQGIEILGALPHDRVLELMKAVGIVVVPSRVWENQPTVILEALAAGCRVIASDVGGIPETLGKAGWIVPAGDAVALVSAIRATLTTNQDTLRAQDEERQRILRLHSSEAVLDALEGCLRSNL